MLPTPPCVEQIVAIFVKIGIAFFDKNGNKYWGFLLERWLVFCFILETLPKAEPPTTGRGAIVLAAVLLIQEQCSYKIVFIGIRSETGNNAPITVSPY